MTIASSAPFKPKINKLSEKVGLSRNMRVQALKILELAGLVNALYKDNVGIGVLTKPQKLYLNNSKLMYILSKDNTNIGNARDTFFLNQFKSLHEINLYEHAGFLTDKNDTFETGGKNKLKKQIADMENAYLAIDNIEIGFGNIIPIWLFGFKC